MRTSDDRAAYRFAPEPGVIEMPTLDRQCDCMCPWVVVRAGPGRECISRLKRQNQACPYRHEPEVTQ